MTHIEQMIQDMCPNGVEFKTLGEVCIVKTAPMKLDKKEYQEQGLYPIVDQGQKFIVGYTDNAEALVPADDYVIFGDHTREIKYVDFTFAQGADGVKILKTKNEILPRFLYHVLKNTQIPSRGYNRHWTIAKDIEIPLPPIEIQKKIVECLDKFSALAAELQAELQAELHLRRKQYEYYRTQLLTPHSDCNSADNTDDAQWEWKTLGEVCELVKDRISASELDTETYVSVENLLPNKMGKIASTSVPTTGNVINYHKDNVLIGNIRPYLRKIWLANCDGGTNGDVITLSIKDEYKNLILPRFLYHALADERFFIYDTQYSSGAKMPRGDKERVMEYQIALPSLAEQARIVAILDKFEKLITSMEEGIPAEQIRQQKRYEHFRDLLLTFDRKAE